MSSSFHSKEKAVAKAIAVKAKKEAPPSDVTDAVVKKLLC
jgi:ribosomal protein L20A (L18A)